MCGTVDFKVDPLDQRRAREEARARIFASPDRVRLGRYELGTRLGAGSWGVVYRAHDPLTRRAVAVKVLHGPQPDLSRWRREAQLLAKLDHPHVIRVFDVGVEGGRAYLVTQIVRQGRTLTQWLSAGRPNLPTLLRGFATLADALSEVHARGVLHRDIKPDNILVDQDGNFLLVDFGLAAEVHEITTSSGLEGTPAFLPPEVRAGAPADRRADVYSLCASLWFAVCGRPSPRGVPPPGLRRLFRGGLSPDPKARFADARSFRRALQAALQPPAPWSRLAATLVVGIAAALAVLSPVTEASERSRPTALRDGPTSDNDAVLERIGQLQEAERFDRAAALATELLRTTRNPTHRAPLELELGRARYASGALTDAEHVLESAFFHASASGNPHRAAEAALLRLEVAVDAADVQASAVWSEEARVWLQRRSLPDPAQDLRLAVAESKRLVLLGRTREALQRLPASPVGNAPRSRIALWSQRGEVLNRLGRTTQGLDAFATASRLADQHFAAGHGLRRSARWNVAATRFERGEFSEAAVGFEALLLATAQLDPAPLSELAELHRNLGAVYFELGKIDAAVVHTETAVDASEDAYGSGHNRTLEALGNLAAVLHAAGQDDAARDASWRALVAVDAEYGGMHPRLVPLLINLAVMESDAGADHDAEAHLRRAERILDAQDGAMPRAMASLQTNLARTLSRLGDSTGAQRAATNAVELLEATLGPTHPELAEALLQLAASNLEVGRNPEAAALALRVRALSGITRDRRARAAFILDELNALGRDRSASRDWITVAETEFAPSSDRSSPEFSRAWRRWRASTNRDRPGAKQRRQ